METIIDYNLDADITFAHIFIDQSETENPFIKRGLEHHDFFNENEYIELELGIDNNTKTIVTKVAVIHDTETWDTADEITWIDSYDNEVCSLVLNEYLKGVTPCA